MKPSVAKSQKVVVKVWCYVIMCQLLIALRNQARFIITFDACADSGYQVPFFPPPSLHPGKKGLGTRLLIALTTEIECHHY